MRADESAEDSAAFEGVAEEDTVQEVPGSPEILTEEKVDVKTEGGRSGGRNRKRRIADDSVSPPERPRKRPWYVEYPRIFLSLNGAFRRDAGNKTKKKTKEKKKHSLGSVFFSSNIFLFI